MSAPAPTSTVSTLGVFVEVELTFSVGAVTWLSTLAEVSPGVPPIDSVPILMRGERGAADVGLAVHGLAADRGARADDRDDVIAGVAVGQHQDASLRR